MAPVGRRGPAGDPGARGAPADHDRPATGASSCARRPLQHRRPGEVQPRRGRRRAPAGHPVGLLDERHGQPGGQRRPRARSAGRARRPRRRRRDRAPARRRRWPGRPAASGEPARPPRGSGSARRRRHRRHRTSTLRERVLQRLRPARSSRVAGRIAPAAAAGQRVPGRHRIGRGARAEHVQAVQPAGGRPWVLAGGVQRVGQQQRGAAARRDALQLLQRPPAAPAPDRSSRVRASDSRSSTTPAAGRRVPVPSRIERLGGERDDAAAQAVRARADDRGGGDRGQRDARGRSSSRCDRRAGRRPGAPRRTGGRRGRCGSRGRRPELRSSVRSRSRSPSVAPARATIRRVPRRRGSPTRPSGGSSRSASRRASRRSAGSVATARSASSATAASPSRDSCGGERVLVKPADAAARPRRSRRGRAPARRGSAVRRARFSIAPAGLLRAQRAASAGGRPAGAALVLPDAGSGGGGQRLLEQLGDHLLGGPVLVLVDPDPSRQRRHRGIEQAIAVQRRRSRAAARSPRASRTMSIAPRTEAPLRTAGCVRVPRVTVTARSTSGSSGGRSGGERPRARRPRRDSRSPPGTCGRRSPG